MKLNLLATLVISMLIIGCATTQSYAPDGSPIPTGVNTIVADTDISQESAFTEIGNFLIQKGYSIKITSPEFYSIETNYKRTSTGAGVINTPLDIAINVSVTNGSNGSNIIFSGKYKSEYAEDLSIENKGGSNSVWQVTWNEFYELVKSYSSNLSFERK